MAELFDIDADAAFCGVAVVQSGAAAVGLGHRSDRRCDGNLDEPSS
jgi:hypothetical protein